MESLDKVKAILHIRPNAEFVMRDDVVEWLDTKQTEPTKKEIELAWISYQTSQEAEAELKAQAKATAESKLAALGLTTDDLRALGL